MIRIVDYGKFQHYKKRNPPWIRLYRSLLDSSEWRALEDFAGRLLVELWLLGSESEPRGEIHLDSAGLAWRLRYASTRVDEITAALRTLVDAGYIEIDSILLAERKQDATPESESESNTETESESETDPGADEVSSMYEKHPHLKRIHDCPMLRGVTLAQWLRILQNRSEYIDMEKALTRVLDRAELEQHIKSPAKYVDSQLSYYEVDHRDSIARREKDAIEQEREVAAVVEVIGEHGPDDPLTKRMLSSLKHMFGSGAVEDANSKAAKLKGAVNV